MISSTKSLLSTYNQENSEAANRQDQQLAASAATQLVMHTKAELTDEIAVGLNFTQLMDKNKSFISTIMALHIYLANGCLVISLLSVMVTDKELGHRAYLSLMGMTRLAYLSANFIACQCKCHFGTLETVLF
ncbi:unnamed protein product [Protopolystoma xenopodis]|uniref:Uncharacterized protein n=1 Tax=Protopolystoma xenopodis TaxID=117903 RepID=A0A3S5AB96_9PLAT|nr:unnamed protein product [Protopolystoma xenopodis]